MLEPIFNAKLSRLLATAFVVVGGICSGGLFLALYEPQFFYTTDVFRLIVIALSIPLPLMIVDSVVTNMLVTEEDEADQDRKERINWMSIAFGSAMAMTSLYIACVVAFYTTHRSAKTGVNIVIIANLLMIFSVRLVALSEKRNEHKRKVHNVEKASK